MYIQHQAGQALLTTLAADFQLSGKLRRGMAQFLQQYGHPATARHCARVAAEARRLATRFSADEPAAETAGLLHDISVVIPNEERIAAAHGLGVAVLPEEAIFPMIIHQKLSVVLARELFGVTDAATLWDAPFANALPRIHAAMLYFCHQSKCALLKGAILYVNHNHTHR